MLGCWCAGGPGLGNTDWAWVLDVWKSRVPSQHMCQELGTLVGRQRSRRAHPAPHAPSTRRLSLGRLCRETQALLGADCGLIRGRGRGCVGGGLLRECAAGEGDF